MDTRFYLALGTGYTSIPLAPSATLALPSTFHVVPGLYVYNGVGYDLTALGRYLFADPVTEVIMQRITWDATNIPAYISAFSACHLDGKYDDGTSIPLGSADLTAYLNALKTRPVEMHCGYIADLMRTMMSQFAPAIPARLVQMTEGIVPTNNDIGHIVFEEKSSGAWRLWDVTNGVYFADSSGNHLNLKDLINLGITNATMVRISEKKTSYDVGFGLWEEFWGQTDANVRAWCNRIYQIPAVKSGSTWYAYVPSALSSRTSYITGLGFTVQSQATWESTWYP